VGLTPSVANYLLWSGIRKGRYPTAPSNTAAHAVHAHGCSWRWVTASTAAWCARSARSVHSAIFCATRFEQSCTK